MILQLNSLKTFNNENESNSSPFPVHLYGGIRNKLLAEDGFILFDYSTITVDIIFTSLIASKSDGEGK